jgi:hypothetical protein
MRLRAAFSAMMVLGASAGCAHQPPSGAASQHSAAPAAASATAHGRWGAARTDPATEASIRSAFAATAKGEVGAFLAYDSVVMVGQQLWDKLRLSDRDIAQRGKPTSAVVPIGNGRALQLEMRMFFQDQVNDLVNSKGFQKLAGYYSAGVLRAATEAERMVWYAVISFEIEKQSVVCYERDGEILIVYLDGTPPRVRYLELMKAHPALTGS